MQLLKFEADALWSDLRFSRAHLNLHFAIRSTWTLAKETLKTDHNRRWTHNLIRGNQYQTIWEGGCWPCRLSPLSGPSPHVSDIFKLGLPYVRTKPFTWADSCLSQPPCCLEIQISTQKSPKAKLGAATTHWKLLYLLDNMRILTWRCRRYPQPPIFDRERCSKSQVTTLSWISCWYPIDLQKTYGKKQSKS